MKKSDIGFGMIIILILVAVALIPVGIGLCYTAIVVAPTQKDLNVTVNEKWIKSHGDSGQLYLFSDMEGNVYKIDDDWSWPVFFKVNSSDQYAMIKPGQTYHIHTVGWRTQWMSQYPNVLYIYDD